MKKFAVIVAGGAGTRMGTAVPKQFILLGGKPVLWHSVNAFLSAYDDMEIIVVLPAGQGDPGQWDPAQKGAGQASTDSWGDPGRIRCVTGGKTRFHSVARGLELVEEEVKKGGEPLREGAVVAVHDGVRPLVSVGLIRRCFEQAERVGSAIPVVDCRDSVRMIKDGGSEPIDRNRIKLVQTPQTFLGKILLPAYRAAYRDVFTDEATVVEAEGHQVHLIEGDVNNIKITLPGDLLLAERLIHGV